MRKLQFSIATILCLLASPAIAGEIQVRGEASLPVPKKDPQSVRAAALQEAKHRAVIVAINRVLGADSTNDPAINSKIDEVAEQIADSQIVDSSGQVMDGQYKQSVTLVLDDKSFRQLLTDEGIAIHTADVRASAVLAIMDEYVTTEKNLKAPLKDLEEYSSQTGGSYADRSSSGAARKSADASAAKFAEAHYDAASAAQRSSSSHDDNLNGSMSGSNGGQASGSGNGDNFSGSYSNQASASVAARSRGNDSNQVAAGFVSASSASGSTASAHQSSAAAYSKTDVTAEEHDNVNYRHLIEYQPPSTAPEKQDRTLSALEQELNDYGVKLYDNDLFRSKYFGNRPVTLDQVLGGNELAKYAEYARTEANADFLMVGTSVIIDQGRSALTGEYVCTGMATLKTYATSDAEIIAATTVSETAAGQGLDECAANVARKMAESGGAALGQQIQDRSKKSSMYGREYTVDLTGSSLPLMLKANFFRSLQTVPGVASVAAPRINNERLYQVVVTYKGADPLDMAVATAMASNPAFASLDGHSEGSHVVFCMGPCPSAGSK